MSIGPVRGSFRRAWRDLVMREDLTSRILMVAGERSGDLHGAELAGALKQILDGVEVWGCGGEAMRQAGVDLVADLRDFAMVGITEVVAGLPRARRAFNALLPVAQPASGTTAQRAWHTSGLLRESPDLGVEKVADAPPAEARGQDALHL
jgi:hypothetical protein